LPLGAIANRRSLVALDNLVDLVRVCCFHDKAANQTFLVSDGEDLSTTELIRRVGRALERRPLLVPVPAPVLEIAAMAVGKRSQVRRLVASLEVDIAETCQCLGWSPVVRVDDALRETVRSFHSIR